MKAKIEVIIRDEQGKVIGQLEPQAMKPSPANGEGRFRIEAGGKQGESQF
jgi:hypothetical protein